MDDKIQSFLGLNVWKKAHALTLKIYELTATFPASEQYTLADQLKRSASMVASTIADGFQKRNKQDKTRLYNDAQSALNDIYYLLLLSKDLGYGDTSELMENAHEIQKMLGGLIRSVLGIQKTIRPENRESSGTGDIHEVDLL